MPSGSARSLPRPTLWSPRSERRRFLHNNSKLPGLGRGAYYYIVILVLCVYLKATMVLATAMVVMSSAFRKAGSQMLPVFL